MKKSLFGKSRRLCLCVVFSVVFISPNVFGQTKNDDIVKLLKVSGTAQVADQLVGTMISQFQMMYPGVPATVWDAFKKKMDVEEFLRMCVPIYSKHYSHDEIKQLIKIYESPLGRKMVQVTPAVLQESMALGQKWGEKLGAELVKELQSGGF